MMVFLFHRFDVQDTLTVSPTRHEERRGECMIQWDGLVAAVDITILSHDQVMTEEAFNILLKFGQLPSSGLDGGALEAFARRAQKLKGKKSMSPARTSTSTGMAIVEAVYPRDASDTNVIMPTAGACRSSSAKSKVLKELINGVDSHLTPTIRQTGCDQSSLWMVPQQHEDQGSTDFLTPSDVAVLAAEFDPLKRADRAFAALEAVLTSRSASDGPAVSVDLTRQNRRSPLQLFAVARRSRSWLGQLKAAGDRLLTMRLKLGRHGQDLLTHEPTGDTPKELSMAEATPRVTATELIAEARAVVATAERQYASAATTDCPTANSGVVLSARVLSNTPLPSRSTKNLEAFDAWGYYSRWPTPSKNSRPSAAMLTADRESGGDGVIHGEAVTVLKVAAERAGQAAGDGMTDAVDVAQKTSRENVLFAAGLLSVPSLREHPGLIKIHPAARVALDETDSVDKGGGDCAAGIAANGYDPVYVVCERLKGWRPLHEVIKEHGGLVTPSDISAGQDEGLRVLRVWGRQLAATLELLESRSLVLRDLNASTVMVSPDGSNLKVVGFSSLAVLSSDGVISPEAPYLDITLHGPTKPITPPEALTRSVNYAKTDSIRGVACSSNIPHGTRDEKDDHPLVLAGNTRPGAFKTTAAWDIWTFGILLFELAFGRSPPAYGNSLAKAMASSSQIPTVVDDIEDLKLGNIARAVQYDFLSTAGDYEQNVCGSGAVGTCSAIGRGIHPMTEALQYTSFGAAIGARSSFHLSSIERGGDAAIRVSREEAGDGRTAVQLLRRAWVRRQLYLEERGDFGVMTWQSFQKRIRDHFHASATAVPSSLARHTTSPLSNDRWSGKTFPRVDRHSGRATSSEFLARPGPAAIEKLVVRFREADMRGTGYLPIRTVQAVVRDELHLAFSPTETEMLVACLHGGVPKNGSDGEDLDGDDHERLNNISGDAVSKNEDILYAPVVHILRSNLPRSYCDSASSHSGDILRAPTPASLVELLSACLEPDPSRRPSPADLVHVPLLALSGGTEGNGRKDDPRDLAAAAAYVGGQGNDLSLTLVLRERVELPVQAIEDAALSATARSDAVHDGGDNPDKCEQRSSASDLVHGCSSGDVPCSVGAGALVNALSELERLMQQSPARLVPEDPRQAQRIARGHATVIKRIFESGTLVRVSSLALQFLDSEEVRLLVLELCMVQFFAETVAFREFFQHNFAVMSLSWTSLQRITSNAMKSRKRMLCSSSTEFIV